MDYTTRISCCAATHIGASRAVNEDRIYANGKFLETFDYDNSCISIEANSNQFIFAISEGMDNGLDSDSRISINDELLKFQQKVKSSIKEIQVKLDDMAEYVQQSSNLLYSISLGSDIEKEWNPSFAGMIIDNGQLAAVSIGTCKIFKLESGGLKLLISDNRKTERLLRMGIINDEQAELISGQYKNSSADNSLKVKKSEIYSVKEGSIYLVCSFGLLNALNEEAICEILMENKNTDVAVGTLIKEAVETGEADNISAMVIKVEKAAIAANVDESTKSGTVKRVQSTPTRYSRVVRRKRSFDYSKLIQTGLLVAVIAAILFGGFQVWKLLNPNKVKDALAENDKQTSAMDKSNKSTVPTDDTNEIESTQSSTATDSDDTDSTAEPTGNGAKVIDANTTYKVVAGDSLRKISRDFYGDEKKYTLIMDANKITNAERIQIGQILKIPPLE